MLRVNDGVTPAWYQPAQGSWGRHRWLCPVRQEDLEPAPEPGASGSRKPEKCPAKVSADLDLNFRIRYTRWPDVWEWLDHLWATDFHHGTELVMSLGSPRGDKPGMTDNAAWVDRLLRSMVEYNWIRKHDKATPCLTRRAWGDLGGGKIDEKSPYAVDYGFSPNRQHPELMAFLGVEPNAGPVSFPAARDPLLVTVPRALPVSPELSPAVTDADVPGGAEWSPDGQYRWWLWRELDASNTQTVLFVMLNPSTAGAKKNDPTMRRCIDFARRWGYGRLEVVNLFAISTPNPDDLPHAAERVGAENDRWIQQAIGRADRIVCAWGNWGAHAVLQDRTQQVVAGISHLPLWSIGKLTKSGQPSHPLMLKADLPLLPYTPVTGVVHPSKRGRKPPVVNADPGVAEVPLRLLPGPEGTLAASEASTQLLTQETKKRSAKPAPRQLLVLTGGDARTLGQLEDRPACFGGYEAGVCDGSFCDSHFLPCQARAAQPAGGPDAGIAATQEIPLPVREAMPSV